MYAEPLPLQRQGGTEVRRRTEGPGPDGGRDVCEWDDETGDFDLTQYDAGGQFVSHRQRTYINADAPVGELMAEDVYLDSSGDEIRREQVVSAGLTEDESGGWS